MRWKVDYGWSRTGVGENKEGVLMVIGFLGCRGTGGGGSGKKMF